MLSRERTDDEILAQVEAIGSVDFFGFRRGNLLSCLTFDQVRPHLKPDATAEKWGDPKPRDPESVRAEVLDYMPFAWDKANNCRGLSAARSIDHMSAWLWLLGHDEASEQILEYSHYGKPQLRAICEAFSWDWRQWDDGRWTEDELSDGTAPPESVPPLKINEETTS